MGVAVGMLCAGLILGYLFGARKDIWKMLKKALDAASAKDDKKGADGDDGGENEDDDEENALGDDIISGYLDNGWVGGHDDHPDTEFNPIFVYQVKKAKDEIRVKKQIEALLLARDLPVDHLDKMSFAERKAFMAELMADSSGVKAASNVGSVNGKVRKYGSTVNSTHILVLNGARFMPKSAGSLSSAASEGQEKKRAQEVRDKLRVIDTHLSTTADIDVSRGGMERQGTMLKAGQQGLSKNALEKAKETKYKPYGGDRMKLMEELGTYAARGRARVSAPLDHAISAQNEKTRRASACGRRASVASKGGSRSSQYGGGKKDEDTSDPMAEKMKRASAAMGGDDLAA